MFDPLKKEKAKIQLASTNAELAKKYTGRQLQNAKSKSHSFLSSPTGIASMFLAGSINGASVDVAKPASSIIFTSLLKLI